jgi:hypothetical protein
VRPRHAQLLELLQQGRVAGIVAQVFPHEVDDLPVEIIATDVVVTIAVLHLDAVRPAEVEQRDIQRRGAEVHNEQRACWAARGGHVPADGLGLAEQAGRPGARNPGGFKQRGPLRLAPPGRMRQQQRLRPVPCLVEDRRPGVADHGRDTAHERQ